MDHIISKLLVYGDMDKDSILMQIGDICTKTRDHTQSAARLGT